MKQYVSSSGFPSTETTLLLFVLAFIVSVLFILMLSPAALTLSLHSCVSLASVYDCVRGGPGHRRNTYRPAAPKGPLDSISSVFVVVFIIQSMANRNMNGDRSHPCLTPDFTWKDSVSQPA